MFMDDRLESAAAGAFTRVSVDKAEVEREAVIAMLDRERRSCRQCDRFGMLAVGVAMMPNLLPMTLLLALRLASYIYTRMAVTGLNTHPHAPAGQRGATRDFRHVPHRHNAGADAVAAPARGWWSRSI